MKIDSLETLLEEELEDIYSAEKQLVKALPKMAKTASSDELCAGFEEHLAVTKGQVTRLEKVFKTLSKTAKAKKAFMPPCSIGPNACYSWRQLRWSAAHQPNIRQLKARAACGPGAMGDAQGR